MILQQVTAPASEPITASELQLHLRLGDDIATEEESLLLGILQTSREHVEDVTRRALFTQTWDMFLNEFPSGTAIKIPFGNLQSVTYVKYTDSDGNFTTLTEGSDYIVETNGCHCGFVKLPYSGSWPLATLGVSNPVHIRFVAGWSDVDDIPAKIKVAIKMICHDLYENRESQAFTVSGGYIENSTVGKLLSSVRLMDAFR